MDVNQFAAEVLGQVQTVTTGTPAILAHISDKQIHWAINQLHSPFTADESEALFHSLRDAQDEEALESALVEKAYLPALNHWWEWLRSHWDEVAAKVDEERGRAERCLDWERRIATDPAFAEKHKLSGHWKSRDSLIVGEIWEALAGIRAAEDTGGDIDAAFCRFADIREKAQNEELSSWWETVVGYDKVSVDWHWLLTLAGNWLREPKP